jgi:hypothetical protein
MDYLIVLFKNKKRKKIINKFKTLERAKLFFNKKIQESNQVYFNKQVENAVHCEFDLGIVSNKDNNFDVYFIKDSLGRQMRVDVDGDFKILELNPYNVSEKIFDITQNKKISFDDFLKKYLIKKSVKLISRLNNKVVVQDDNLLNLFSFKNENESFRFLEGLNNYMIDNGRMDCIIVSETSKAQKKYLYDTLSKMGVDKKLLYRTTTTFKERK